MNFALFGRFFLEFAMMYPAEYLCLASLQEHLRAPRKTYAIGASAITLMGLAGAAVCCMLDIETNFLLIPLLIISFWLLRWRTDREVSISQTMFLFSVSAVMMSVCTLLAIVLNAEAELDNAQPVFLPSTSVICLTLSVILSAIFRFTAVRWSRWLLQEYHGEAFWESAWPLPALYAAFLVFCMPKEIGVILMKRIRIIAVLAVSISLLGIFLLLYEMYRVAKEYARSSQLDRENQLLAVESRRYMELRSYLEQTRHLRHDFRQHLAVIRDCADRGDLASLKNYLNDYENMFPIQEVRTYCKNYAVNAILSFYAEKAEKNGISMQVTIQMADPPVIPETEFCVLVGNLLENAVDACADTDAEIQSFIRLHVVQTGSSMLSITADNTSSGSPNWSGDKLLSTKHSGYGIGTESIRMIAERYSGDARFRWKDGIFYASVMLNPQV